MKKFIFALAICMVLPLSMTFAQFSTNQIVYDFKDKTITYPKKKGDGRELKFVQYKKPATLRINNINTLLYTISVKGENIELNAETPEVFKLFFNTEKFTGKETGTNPAVAPGKKEGVAGYKALVGEAITALRYLEETKTTYDNIYLAAYSDGKTAAEIKEELKSANLFGSGATLPTKTQLILACKTRLEAYTQKVEEADGLYKTLKAVERDSVEDEYQQLADLNKKVEKFDYEELFQKTAVLYEKACDPNTFSYTSSPLIAEKDYINYSLEIKPKEDLKFTQPEREEKFELPVYVRGGVKVDFSTGIFFASTEIMDRKYHADSIPNDSLSKVILRENTRNIFAPALGAMVHASFRGPCWFKPALSFGLGINSTDITDAVYTLGLSGIFGNEERFILSLGAIGKQANELKGRYENNGNILISDFTDNDALVEKTFKVGFFVGLTYNLTSKKKGQ